jgi:L-ascorbate oxidase
MKRSITVVNRMMPGPSIEVCLNDTIIVDVKNRLMSEGTTIHWHGIHQRNSPFMDGVPHIAQCAIPAGQNFRYNFNAENAGTHFWHSHLGMQRGDGVFGALIVRNPEELHENLYDFDMSEHIMISNDWTHLPATSIFTAHHHGKGSNKPPNILINGRGKYFGNMTLKAVTTTESFKIEVLEAAAKEEEDLTTLRSEETTTYFYPHENEHDEEEIHTTEKRNIILNDQAKNRTKRNLLEPDEDSAFVPYEVFNVVKGHRYRFRHINAGFLNCPIEFSVDNHSILAIASDGNSLEPLEVTFLVTYAGERWDFIINADQEVGNYYIRARGLMDCDDRFTSSFQMAVLHYQGAPEENPRNVKVGYNHTRKGITLNSLNAAYVQRGSVTVAEMKSVEKRPNNIMKAQPDFKFFLSYDFYGKDNHLFHLSNLYGFNQGLKFY